MLWRLPHTPIWRNIKQESTGHFVPGVMVVRVGASMYFANVAFIRDYIQKMVGEFSEAADTVSVASATSSTGAPATRARDEVVSEDNLRGERNQPHRGGQAG